ncbi:hypothetical protein ACOSQ4_029843 [Xanthoceras sorbifolium]
MRSLYGAMHLRRLGARGVHPRFRAHLPMMDGLLTVDQNKRNLLLFGLVCPPIEDCWNRVVTFVQNFDFACSFFVHVGCRFAGVAGSSSSPVGSGFGCRSVGFSCRTVEAFSGCKPVGVNAGGVGCKCGKAENGSFGAGVGGGYVGIVCRPAGVFSGYKAMGATADGAGCRLWELLVVEMGAAAGVAGVVSSCSRLASVTEIVNGCSGSACAVGFIDGCFGLAGGFSGAAGGSSRPIGVETVGVACRPAEDVSGYRAVGFAPGCRLSEAGCRSVETGSGIGLLGLFAGWQELFLVIGLVGLLAGMLVELLVAVLLGLVLFTGLLVMTAGCLELLLLIAGMLAGWLLMLASSN